MEKVQAGSLSEEFSFSRALHLMRYGRAKCRPVSMGNQRYYFVKDEKIIKHYPNEAGEFAIETMD